MRFSISPLCASQVDMLCFFLSQKHKLKLIESSLVVYFNYQYFQMIKNHFMDLVVEASYNSNLSNIKLGHYTIT